MLYYLMRKNDIVRIIDISENGSITKLGKILRDELLPLQDRTSYTGVISWWNDRSIPIKQGKIEAMLRDKGIATTGLYLAQNLGLSLTDYYWISPVTRELSWEQVNLFENEFKENLLLGKIQVPEENNFTTYQPNSSLQGNLEKTWIIDKGVRKLIKGNHSELSSESINEVIISDAVRKQGMPSAQYALIKIKGKPYNYGCISPIFTSLSLELVSAYAVITSEIKPNNISVYEHFINVCHKNGLDKDYVRNYLEFQILIDFIFSNRDRHLTNIAILRNSDSLQFETLAPIFDSGKSMMVGKEPFVITDKRLLSQETLGFKNNEYEMLKLVKNRKLIDINKLPSPEKVKEMYLKDSKIAPYHLDFIIEFYKRKIDVYEKYSTGADLRNLKYAKY